MTTRDAMKICYYRLMSLAHSNPCKVYFPVNAPNSRRELWLRSFLRDVCTSCGTPTSQPAAIRRDGEPETGTLGTPDTGRNVQESFSTQGAIQGNILLLLLVRCMRVTFEYTDTNVNTICYWYHMRNAHAALA